MQQRLELQVTDERSAKEYDVIQKIMKLKPTSFVCPICKNRHQWNGTNLSSYSDMPYGLVCRPCGTRKFVFPVEVNIIFCDDGVELYYFDGGCIKFYLPYSEIRYNKEKATLYLNGFKTEFNKYSHIDPSMEFEFDSNQFGKCFDTRG